MNFKHPFNKLLNTSFSGKKYSLIIILQACIVIISFLFGMHAADRDIEPPQGSEELREGGHVYTSPLLECRSATYENNRSVKALENKIIDYTDTLKSEKKLDKISVYFRNLNNGPWFGVNEDEKFDPASLLKVPMMVAYFKLSETHPEILEKKITYNGEYDKSDNLSDPQKSITKGNTYTIEKLIYNMVTYSDNKSLNLVHRYIVENVDKKLLDKISMDMGIFIPMELGQETKYSITDYSSVFRILYNSSYLNRELSEKALSIMADSDYDDGLAAAIPKDVKIANKYGVHLSKDGETLQLHDCGIIYHDKTPYLLFVMTKAGKEKQNNLVRAIQEISKLVYDDINNSTSK